MTQTLPAPQRPWIEIRGARMRLWPILLAALVMQACLAPARELARFLFRSGPEALQPNVGLFVFLATMLQGLSALVGIAIMKRLLPGADAHLRWPPGRSLVPTAMLVGLCMGLVMLAADYGPAMLSGVAPGGYPLDPPLASGWLLAMVTTGLGEETLFRGLLVGMLAVLCPGRVRFGGFEIPIAGIIVAVLFSLGHYESFLHGPVGEAIGQQIYAFGWALIYVWLMERSRSLLAPIVAHGVGNFTEVALVMTVNAVCA